MTTLHPAAHSADPPGGFWRGAVTAPPLPEQLFAARARKGVDLHRAERDTRIRLRYLDALERGEYGALPSAVHAQGFLRNYALYLGLDPDEAVEQFRRERGGVGATQRIAVPRPVDLPRPGLALSASAVWAILLTAGVAAFVVYLGVQFLRVARPPTLTVTAPSVAALTVDEGTTSYVLRGTSTPGATIAVATPGGDRPYRVTAGADGSWTTRVELRRGPNQFDITATDPTTRKTVEEPVQVLIRVPFLVVPAAS